MAVSVANSRTGSSTTLDFKLTMDTQAIDDKRLAKITRPARECCSVAGRGKQKKHRHDIVPPRCATVCLRHRCVRIMEPRIDFWTSAKVRHDSLRCRPMRRLYASSWRHRLDCVSHQRESDGSKRVAQRLVCCRLSTLVRCVERLFLGEKQTDIRSVSDHVMVRAPRLGITKFSPDNALDRSILKAAQPGIARVDSSEAL